MDIVTGDLETFWSTEHTLTKMNPIDYVMHPDTEIISNALKINNEPTTCVFGEDAVRRQLARVDWDNAMFVAHNMSGFDAMIYAWRLGIRPKLWGCTLAMARPIHAKTIGVSLARLVAYYGIGVKNNAALVNTRGKHLKDFTNREVMDMRVYNIDDADQCYGLLKCLRPHYTAAELWHIDCKIRGIVEPEFMVDVPMMEAALVQERANKRAVLLELAQMFEKNVMPLGGDIGAVDEDYLAERVRATLASAPMFSALLDARGVPVPMKRSKKTRKMTPALAKNDLGFMALVEHDDEVVAMAAQARLSVKSTIAETRLESIIKTAGFVGNRWPVTVNYCGADTTGRPSGWLYNPLNLPKLKEGKPKPGDAMRRGLYAPEGMKIVEADASGIEMRFNHFLWNVKYSTDLWRSKADADIYIPTAATFYGVPVEKITKAMRQTGKVQQLACGFQCGGRTYVDMARTMGGLRLTLDEATQQVKSWRGLTPEIADYKEGGWARCHESLHAIMNQIEDYPLDPRGIFRTHKEGILLPSGRLIRYPSLRIDTFENVEEDTGEIEVKEAIMYGEGRHKVFIYGGKVDENIVQAGARDLVYDAALRIYQRTGYRPKLEIYDSLAYIVPEDKAERHLEIVNEELRRPPDWFPDLVLWSEGGIADRYSDVK